MAKSNPGRLRDVISLCARILLVLLFLISGWGKLTDYVGTVDYMMQTGVPFPSLAAIVAIVIEVGASIALILGVLVRPLAIFMALYTLATALIGHHYWTMTGAAELANMTNFYKNISITAGFLLLYLTGAGEYSIDARVRRHA